MVTDKARFLGGVVGDGFVVGCQETAKACVFANEVPDVRVVPNVEDGDVGAFGCAANVDKQETVAEVHPRNASGSSSWVTSDKEGSDTPSVVCV